MEAIEQQIPAAEMERMMKIQEVILKAMAGKLKWWEAAEIIGRDGPDDAALAGAVSGARLQRIVGLPQATAEPEAGAGGRAGAGAAAVPGAVLRFQRAALSREAARGTRDPAQLQVGEDGAAGSGVGEEAQEAGIASQAAAAAAVAGDDAAHRWQRASLVRRRAASTN